jgi:hypothetical protein
MRASLWNGSIKGTHVRNLPTFERPVQTTFMAPLRQVGAELWVGRWIC